MEQATAYPRRYAKVRNRSVHGEVPSSRPILLIVHRQACDACHRKKIRCIFSEPACQLCRKTGQICKFTRIEKSLPKRARRGKHLAVLEERMKAMETQLQQSKEIETPSEQGASRAGRRADNDDHGEPLTPDIFTGPIARHRHRLLKEGFLFPPRDETMRLAQGYFASHNHMFPIISRERFMRRLRVDYPPDRHDDFVWWAAVLVVLTFAHRLRAMSAPALAEAENHKACPFLVQILDVAPKLTFMKPSLEAAQVLLATAAILRGTPMPDPVPMLTSVAIRMLQCCDVHHEESPDGPDFPDRTERMQTFWVAYIMDKDIALQFRRPPVLHEQDIGRQSIDREQLRESVVFSLDLCSEANLFAISQSLAVIQGQVWSMIYGESMTKDAEALEAARAMLNPGLAAWKESLPFRFRREDLVGRWPKHAIVNIVTLHFRYFHTLVELNKEPPLEPGDPLSGDCPLSKSLHNWPHSTSLLAVEAARDALDLAALTPRGNFQHVWMFFDYSISAMLTLLINRVARPGHDRQPEDLRRVDTWIRVIETLATESERAGLLEKKEFIVHVRRWAAETIEAAVSGCDFGPEEHTCLHERYGTEGGASSASANSGLLGGDWLPDPIDMHADIFPLPMIAREVWEPWAMSGPGAWETVR